jgi:hypothetical protein
LIAALQQLQEAAQIPAVAGLDAVQSRFTGERSLWIIPPAGCGSALQDGSLWVAACGRFAGITSARRWKRAGSRNESCPARRPQASGTRAVSLRVAAGGLLGSDCAGIQLSSSAEAASIWHSLLIRSRCDHSGY